MIHGYDVNGRTSLPVTLHSHKPIDLVILQLGVNDMQQIFNARPKDIARGLGVLLQDIKVSSVGPANVDPDVLVLSPPFCRETATSLEWGYSGCERKSLETTQEFKLMVDQYPGVYFLDITSICKTGTDGIHLDPIANVALGQKIAAQCRTIFDSTVC